jgi:hypothetical protein
LSRMGFNMKYCYLCHQEVEQAQALTWSDWLGFVYMTNPELHERIVHTLRLEQCTGPFDCLLPNGDVVVCEACMMPYALDARCAYCAEALDPSGLCENGCSRQQRCMPEWPGIRLTSCACLLGAIGALATSTGDVQERLALAYARGLEPPGLLDDLPNDLLPAFEQLRARMMFAGNSDLTARLLCDDEARELIETIVRLTAEAARPAPRRIRPDRRHAFEQFMMAVLALAHGTEPLAERLGKAYASHLAQLAANEMSGPAWSRLESIDAQLTRALAPTVRARLKAKHQMRWIIGDVVTLYGQVASEAGQ